MECQIKCNKYTPNIIFDARIWFNNFQPQLLKKRFLGREVMHTILKEGEVLYVPSNFLMFSYAIEPALSITRKFISSTSLDTYLFKEEMKAKDFSELIKAVNDVGRAIIEETLNVKENWKNKREFVDDVPRVSLRN